MAFDSSCFDPHREGLRVLVACEFSGVVRNAFAARGHDAWSCDLLHVENNLRVVTATENKSKHNHFGGGE